MDDPTHTERPLSGPGPDDAGGGAALELSGVCRRFGMTWALAGVDLSVPAGAAVLVAGRNGSGKSTLLRLIAGALRADAGVIRVGGSSDRGSLKRRTALLAHASYTYESLSALENLRVFAQLLRKSAERDALMPLLERVGLGRRASDRVGTYSAGMHKRLALARLLLQEAPVVLLDEPHGELDPPGFALLEELLAQLRSRGTTLVMASHLLERAAVLCDRAVLLESGRIRWQGAARDLAATSHAEFAVTGGGR